MNESSLPLPLPLLDLFHCLRRQDWVLGIDDYLSALEILETGIGVGDREQLKQICTLLWAKTPLEVKRLSEIIDRLPDSSRFERTPPPLNPVGAGSSRPVFPPENVPPENAPPENASPPIPSEITDDPVAKVQAEIRQQEQIQREIEDREIVESVRTGSASATLPPRTPRSTSPVPYRFRRDYFPVTRRQMKQSWRFLRLPSRSGVPSELDIEATIDRVSREGILRDPVLRPRRVNRADLLLLVDQKGSMVPFHPLCRQLIETARGDGKLRQANVYYFQNCPRYDEDDNTYPLFQQATLFGPIALRELASKLDRRTVVLIVSDAGAARGWCDRERIEGTEKFLAALQPLTRYRAWLNPMPRDSWKGTSAEEIARLIPMFPLSRQGLNQAIAVLQGRYLTGTEAKE